MRTPRAPTNVTLGDLLRLGFLHDSDVLSGGHVDGTARLRAERAYAEYSNVHSPNLTPRPYTAPSSRHANFVHHPTHPSTNVHTRRNSMPTVTPCTTGGGPRLTSAHVHRIEVRQTLNAKERERIPKPLQMDTCSVCFSRTRDHAFAPCFHMCVCDVCAKRMEHCPMCRCAVKDVHRIFF